MSPDLTMRSEEKVPNQVEASEIMIWWEKVPWWSVLIKCTLMGPPMLPLVRDEGKEGA